MAINYQISYTFSPSTVISSAEVNQNFSDNANTWIGVEAMTKTFSHIKMDADPGTALEVATKQYVDNSVTASLIGNSKNRILNGEMLFDQNMEGGSYSTSSKMAIYTLDQWRVESTGTGDFGISRSTEASPNAFFPTIMKIQTSTPGTPAAADGCNMEYPMEPIFMRDFGWGTASAKTVTLSFWALCSTTGTYSLSLLNGVDSRSYVTTYSLVSNLWSHIIITVPGDSLVSNTNWPISGTAFGLKIVWDLGSGSNVSTSNLNTWQAGAFWKATGSSNVITVTSNILYLTGVQLEIGSSATSFEYSPYPTMLALLQRYYWKSFPQGTAVAQNAGFAGALTYTAQIASTSAGGGVQVRFPVEMMSTPTMTFFNPGATNAKWRNATSSGSDSGTVSVFSSSLTSSGVYVGNPQVGGDSAGALIAVHAVADARLGGS